MYLLVVLVAGVATAWWMGHRVGMDLSSITAAASILGFTETGRLTHGAAGYTPAVARADQSAPAPYCPPEQAPAFAPAFTALKQRLGDGMGSPVECEHVTSPSGDTQQQTTTGLLAYTKASNIVSFTDGWRHWALTAQGYVTWEGPQSEPPAQ
jgi:hypothetical protein